MRISLAGAHIFGEAAMQLPFPTRSLALLALCVPPAAPAQATPSFHTIGAVTDPKGRNELVSYTISGPRDSLSITLRRRGTRAAFPSTNVRVIADTLTFTWPGAWQGALLVCKLVRRPNWSFAGECHDSDGQAWRMQMLVNEGLLRLLGAS
jgi:hypothetical protein